MSLIDFAHLKNFFQKKKKKLFFQKKTAISHKKIIALACCRILGARVLWGNPADPHFLVLSTFSYASYMM